MGQVGTCLRSDGCTEEAAGFRTSVVQNSRIIDHLNQVQKYVVSSTMTDRDWRNSAILSGDLVEEIRALKENPGRDIVVTGSITLCHALIEAGLVDQYRLFVYPVLQGRGRGLFPGGFDVPRLKLLDATVFRCGVTYSRYAPA